MPNSACRIYRTVRLYFIFLRFLLRIICKFKTHLFLMHDSKVKEKRVKSLIAYATFKYCMLLFQGTRVCAVLIGMHLK